MDLLFKMWTSRPTMKSLGRKKSSPLSLFDDGNSCDSAFRLQSSPTRQKCLKGGFEPFLSFNKMDSIQSGFFRVTIVGCHSPELIFSRGSLCLLTSFLPAAAFPLMSPPASSVLERERGHSQMTSEVGKFPKKKNLGWGMGRGSKDHEDIILEWYLSSLTSRVSSAR